MKETESKSIELTGNELLKLLGYDPNEWNIVDNEIDCFKYATEGAKISFRIDKNVTTTTLK